MAFGAAGYRWKVAGTVGAILGLFAYFMTIAFRRILAHRFSDFNVFYSAAQATLQHGDLYKPMNRSYIYPPLIAFLYAPLALLSEPQAATIVLCANFLFIVLALRWLDKRPAWAGIALGLACNIKYLPIVTLPYLLIRRRWVAAGSFALSC